MTPSEREAAVLDGLLSKKKYTELQNELGLDKNKMYATVTRLIKRGALKRISFGGYEAGDNIPIAYVPIQRKPKEIKAPDINIIPFPTPEPIPEPVAKNDIEDIATTLLEKVSKLQPLLMLHNELFVEIQNTTMTLIERIIEMKPRMLLQKEVDEYRELRALKERSLKIAEQKTLKHK